MMEPEIDRHLAESAMFYRIARTHRGVCLRSERAPWGMVDVQCVCGFCYDNMMHEYKRDDTDESQWKSAAPIVYLRRQEDMCYRHRFRYHVGRCMECGTTNVMFCEEP